jgi:hypothetical protein
MAENDSNILEASFSSLVLTLSSSAWVGLGKIADPISGEMKTDLAGAKFAIDTLVMLREKTKGNLTKDEEKILHSVVAELQANYAETVFSKKQKSDEIPAEKDTSATETGPQQNAEEGNQHKPES